MVMTHVSVAKDKRKNGVGHLLASVPADLVLTVFSGLEQSLNLRNSLHLGVPTEQE